METALVTTNYISKNIDCLFSKYIREKDDLEKIAAFATEHNSVMSHFFNSTRYSHIPHDLFDLKRGMASLNASYWATTINLTGVMECLPAEKKEKWSAMIINRETPDYTPETVIATVESFLVNKDKFFAEKVDGVFRKLSGTHVTNSPDGFRKRMIISHILNSYGSTNSDRINYLNDLREVISIIEDRKGTMKWYHLNDSINEIVRNQKWGEWFIFDGGCFKIKIFKVGTAHIEVSSTIAIKLNRILASLYPAALSTEQRKKEIKKEFNLSQELISFDILDTIHRIADRYKHRDCREIFLSNDTQDEVINILLSIGGKKENERMVFTYNPIPVLKYINRVGLMPNYKAYQFYPTKKDLAQRAINLLEINELDTILEPSAGNGDIADLLPKNQITVLDICDTRCEVLKAKGYNPINEDFLKSNVGGFSKIIMNPPFSEGRAEYHINKALEHLNHNGVLVAILPATLKNHLWNKCSKADYSEIIEESFENTSVRVVIVKIVKCL